MDSNSGKISHHFFDELIGKKLGAVNNNVAVGPRFGVDVAVVDLLCGNALAMASDPLSLIPMLGLQESAWLSVQLMANDIATTGFKPMYAQLVLNLPIELSKNDFKQYWDFIHQYCENIGVSITGGHTCFIEGQQHTLAGGGTMMTVAPKHKIRVSSMASAGDAILVTKSCAISSASILAMCFPKTVVDKVGKDTQRAASSLFYSTSVLDDAMLAVGDTEEERNEITAMHDVTEGGVLGAIYELAMASDCGAEIYSHLVPVSYVQNEVCKVFQLDPKYCIGAGSLIITCKHEAVKNVLNRLNSHDIDCVQVGQLTIKDNGVKLVNDAIVTDITLAQRDPYWTAFYQAYQLGWQ